MKENNLGRAVIEKERNFLIKVKKIGKENKTRKKQEKRKGEIKELVEKNLAKVFHIKCSQKQTSVVIIPENNIMAISL